MPYYVVWKGYNPGIYDSWDACEVQTKGFKGAKYKKFKTLAEAEEAYGRQASDFISTKKASKKKSLQPFIDSGDIITPSLAVDAACSGNPGDMAYRGVDTESGIVIFNRGPYREGTNNIGEFLAIVEALQHITEKDIPQSVVYTDSKTAMAWVKSGYCNSKHRYSEKNPSLYGQIKRAEEWLKANDYTSRILKWNTDRWGEIPADYGRK